MNNPIETKPLPVALYVATTPAPLATVEGEDFPLDGVCQLKPNDPEFEGCTVCQ